jgi:hypothetical protein
LNYLTTQSFPFGIAREDLCLWNAKAVRRPPRVQGMKPGCPFQQSQPSADDVLGKLPGVQWVD